MCVKRHKITTTFLNYKNNELKNKVFFIGTIVAKKKRLLVPQHFLIKIIQQEGLCPMKKYRRHFGKSAD